MKKLPLIGLLIASSLCLSQKTDDYSHLEIIYQMDFQSDTTDLGSRKNEPMVLLIGKNQSLYYSYNKAVLDSTVQKYISQATATNSTISLDAKNFPKSGFGIWYRVYKKDDKIFITDHVVGDMFTYSPENSIVWEIDKNNEIKDIEGYQCKKAYTTLNHRKYTAWYIPDIPISEGPYRFKGLPGLVLEIYDDKNWTVITLASIKKKRILINRPENTLQVTQKEFIEKRKEYYDDPVGYRNNNSRVQSIPLTPRDPPNKDQRENIKRNVNRRNNVFE
jgi:GLPGLI family protein